MIVKIFTEDFLPVKQEVVLINANKQVLDFRHIGSDSNCSLALKWPDYYGEAGIKTRYIQIQRNGPLAFSYLTAINKLGLNIAYGKQVTVTQGTALNPYSAVQDNNARSVSITGTLCSLTIDLGQLTEICGLTLVVSKLNAFSTNLQGATIKFIDNNSTVLTSLSVLSDPTNTPWDLRYEPDESIFPWQESKWVRIQTTFGTYAQKVLIENPPNISVTTSMFKITDATGKEVPISSLQLTSYVLYGKTFSYLDLGRSWEINTVSVNSTAIPATSLIIIQDCNGYIVGLDYAMSLISPPNNLYTFADFRKNKNVGATYPFPVQYGPHGSGILARYIEVLPPNNDTPLYISQIIAVNACGRNVAIGKDTYASRPSGVGSNPAIAVDGVYEDELNENNPFSLMYQKYIGKSIQQSYQSAGGEGDKWMVDLGRFIQLNPENSRNLCDNQITNSACQNKDNIQYNFQHEINCIIFVAPTGYEQQCQNVMVNLYDDSGNMVGSSRITPMVTLYHVDFLDYRKDVTTPLNQSLVEPTRRYTTAYNNTGLMIQFVRVEQIPLYLLAPGSTLKPI